MSAPASRPASRGAPGRRITIIFNPVAGNQRRRLLDRTIELLDRDGWQVAVLGTTGPGNATTLAAQAAMSGEDVIVAAGGDGTIGEVVAGMAGSDIPLGILPMGTANVLAIEFGIPRRAGAIVRYLSAGQTRRLHVAEANERPFLLMAGAGFDGAVVTAVNSELKRALGKAAFLWRGLQVLAAGPASAIDATLDGNRHRCEWAIVTNVVRYGGRFRLCPEADPGESRLCAILFRRAGRAAIFAAFVNLAFGRIARSRNVVAIDAADILLEARDDIAVPLQIDGDSHGTLPVRIAAMDNFVNVLVPPR
jgi:diacylglycerol kinase (ATP)